jgi:hypothetical protein
VHAQVLREPRIREFVTHRAIVADLIQRRLKTRVSGTIVPTMIHENLSQSIENLSARMIAIRDSL